MEESSQDYDDSEIDIKVKTESCDSFEGEQDEFIIPVETEIKTETEEDENPQHVELTYDNNEDSEEVDQSTIKIEDNNGDSNFLHFEFESNQEEFISEEDEQDPFCDISENTSSSNNDNTNNNDNEQEYEVLHEFPASSSSSVLLSMSDSIIHPASTTVTWQQQLPILNRNWQFRQKSRRRKDAEPFKCPIPSCQYKSSFKWESQLRYHIRTYHTEQPSFPCTKENCGSVFYTVPDRIAHMTSHFKFKCPICEKKFEFEDVLDVHLQIHDQKLNLTQEGPALKKLKRKKDDQHLNDFKYVPPLSSILETEAEILNATHKGGYCPKIRRYTCTCGLNYANKYTLDRHLSNVLSGRRYKCSTCAKVFVSFEHFKTHLSTHSAASKNKKRTTVK